MLPATKTTAPNSANALENASIPPLIIPAIDGRMTLKKVLVLKLPSYKPLLPPAGRAPPARLNRTDDKRKRDKHHRYHNRGLVEYNFKTHFSAKPPRKLRGPAPAISSDRQRLSAVQRAGRPDCSARPSRKLISDKHPCNHRSDKHVDESRDDAQLDGSKTAFHAIGSIMLRKMTPSRRE